MKRVFTIAIAIASLLGVSSCGNNIISRMQGAKNVVATCDPEILEARGGEVPTNVSITFPKKYFQPLALMVVTPVIVYEGGETTGEPKIYQGESVKDNNIAVPLAGATVKQSYSFPYVDGMRKCRLELRPVLIAGAEKVDMKPIKVAEGCRTIIQDANVKGDYGFKPDGYEKVVHKKTEGRILYDVNSSTVKDSQIRSASIKEMQEELRAIKEDGKSRITGTEIVTYASPEGGQKYNAELSDRRAKTAGEAWKGINEGVVTDTKQTNVTSVGQDWEGFAEAVQKSNIMDKELILRVLSMYSDPATREKEIRNLSQLYTELKTEVFPELRRARFVTDSEYDNYTDEELKKLAEYRLYALDEPSLLHLASLSNSVDQKYTLYKLALERYNSQPALFNMAKIEMDRNNWIGAREMLKQMTNQKDPDVLNALGICEMNKGNYDDAEEYFIRSGSDEAKKNLGNMEILQGNYAKAAEKLEAVGGDKTALAYLMAGQYDKAATAAAKAGNTAQDDYLRAVIAARMGNEASMREWLAKAAEKDPSLAERAKNDIEFAKYL